MLPIFQLLNYSLDYEMLEMSSNAFSLFLLLTNPQFKTTTLLHCCNYVIIKNDGNRNFKSKSMSAYSSVQHSTLTATHTVVASGHSADAINTLTPL